MSTSNDKVAVGSLSATRAIQRNRRGPMHRTAMKNNNDRYIKRGKLRSSATHMDEDDREILIESALGGSDDDDLKFKKK